VAGDFEKRAANAAAQRRFQRRLRRHLTLLKIEINEASLLTALLDAGKLRETSMLNRDAVARAVERVLAEWIDATGKKL
jgi:hypothetical protein